VSTLTEIEHAIKRLPKTEVAQLATWLAAFRSRPQAASVATHHDLDSLIGTWRDEPAFDAAIRAFEQVDKAVSK